MKVASPKLVWGMFPSKLSNQAKGTLICIVGVLILSPDALLIRKLSNVPNMAVIFFRHLLFTLANEYILLIQHREFAWERIKCIGKWGLAAGSLINVFSVC